MADSEITRRTGREGPDLVTLIAGLLSVAVAVGALAGIGGQLQLLVAISAVAIGIIMLVISARS